MNPLRGSRATSFGSGLNSAVKRGLRFHSAVVDDVSAALGFDRSLAPALAQRFRAALDRRLDDVGLRPESFPYDVAPV